MNQYFHTLSAEKRDSIRHFFITERKDQICEITYKGLFDQSDDDLSPEEVWYEAKRCIEMLKEFDPDELEIECMALFRKLNKRYSAFISSSGELIPRTGSEARHSTMMVLYVVLLMLIDECETLDNHPLNDTFVIINNLIHDIDGLRELHKATHHKESVNEDRGKFVPIQNYRELEDLAEYNTKYGGEFRIEKEESHTSVTTNDTETSRNVDVIVELRPFFYNVEQETANFVSKIRGVEPVDVTAEVNRLLKERKVSDLSCHKPLWKILHRYGLYKCGIKNWNDQIRVPKAK